MELYMKVMLKENQKDEDFIFMLNNILVNHFGATDQDELFNCWRKLMIIANSVNETGGDTDQLRALKKPVTPELLSQKIESLRYGLFQVQLTGHLIPEECIDAIAVCKWIEATGGKYIDPEASKYYAKPMLANYLDPVLTAYGYDPDKLWK